MGRARDGSAICVSYIVAGKATEFAGTLTGLVGEPTGFVGGLTA